MEWGIKQGSRLKELRIKKGFDQAYVANKINVNQCSVSNWEAGKIRPREKHLRDMAFLYNVSIEEITGELAERASELISPATGTVHLNDQGVTYVPAFDKTTSEIVALLSMLTDKTEREITAEAVKHYALMFNWSDCIKQKYFDETDQL